MQLVKNQRVKLTKGEANMVTLYEQTIIDDGIPRDEYYPRAYDAYPEPFTGLHGPNRHTFIAEFGFAIPDEESLNAIAAYSPLLEVAAGLGYWSLELENLGADVIATDAFTTEWKHHFGDRVPWVDVIPMDGVTAVQTYPDRTLLMIWPSYEEEWSTDVLKAYQNEFFCYVGENKWGCCASDSFFDLLHREWTEITDMLIPQWGGIHDYLTIYQRKEI